ncbi:hypothetical protein TNCV_1625821 [Trichonephila clavipes]|nr:hypothetical protein TNCV_1625821 [Trichonephila clavipes]
MMYSGRSTCKPRRKWLRTGACQRAQTGVFVSWLFKTTFSMARDIRSWLPPGSGDYVSTHTIRNILHEVQLWSWVPVTGVPLTSQHRPIRLSWCDRHSI